MTRRTPTDAERLASIREVIEAARWLLERAPVADEGLERSGETFPFGFGCPCCDGTGFVSDDMADRLRAVNAFPPDARLAVDTESEEKPEHEGDEAP